MEGVNSRLRDLVLVVGVAILRLDTPSSRLLDWFLSAHEQGLVKQPGLRSIATPGRRKALQTQARRGTGARRADFARVGPESQANRHAQKPPESTRLVVEAAGIKPASTPGCPQQRRIRPEKVLRSELQRVVMSGQEGPPAHSGRGAAAGSIGEKSAGPISLRAAAPVPEPERGCGANITRCDRVAPGRVVAGLRPFRRAPYLEGQPEACLGGDQDPGGGRDPLGTQRSLARPLDPG